MSGSPGYFFIQFSIYLICNINSEGCFYVFDKCDFYVYGVGEQSSPSTRLIEIRRTVFQLFSVMATGNWLKSHLAFKSTLVWFCALAVCDYLNQIKIHSLSCTVKCAMTGVFHLPRKCCSTELIVEEITL